MSFEKDINEILLDTNFYILLVDDCTFCEKMEQHELDTCVVIHKSYV